MPLKLNFPNLEKELPLVPGKAAPTFTVVNNLNDIVSAALPYTYLIAGLVLFFLLIWSGFELLTAGDNQEAIKRAFGRITHALTGFIIIFLSYWLIQLVELILGVKIF
ncbi:MAG: hypothetical protein ABH807_00100 [Candidatus Shapirobacteria bacterium]